MFYYINVLYELFTAAKWEYIISLSSVLVTSLPTLSLIHLNTNIQGVGTIAHRKSQKPLY